MNVRAYIFVFLLQSLLFSSLSFAEETEYSLLNRISVFPIYVSDSRVLNKELSNEIDEVWWAIRDELTRGRRFLVASRYFMKSKEVFHPKPGLKGADIIVLGKLLDAHGLLTTRFDPAERKISMNLYDAERGWVLWQEREFLDSDRAIKEQLKTTVVKLIKKLITDMPYHGFTTSGVEEEGDLSFINVDFGKGSDFKVGDLVEFIKLEDKSLKPLFLEGGKWQVYAKGRILSEDLNEEKGLFKVEITSAKGDSGHSKYLQKYSLVRRKVFVERDSISMEKTASIRALEDEVKNKSGSALQRKERKKEEKKGLLSALAFIGNIVLFLVLAF